MRPFPYNESLHDSYPQPYKLGPTKKKKKTTALYESRAAQARSSNKTVLFIELSNRTNTAPRAHINGKRIWLAD